jgi:hypothetical protein
MADGIAYEKFFPVIPLAGTAIAVFFDVGYFYGVGVNYFTLFSLTEHIGFALEALPFALFISIFVMLIDAVTEAPKNWEFRKKAATGEHLPPREQLSILKRKFFKLLIVLLLFSAASIGYFWYREHFRLMVLACVAFPMLIAKVLAHNRWYSSGAITLLIIGCAASLLLGEFIGSDYITLSTARDSLVLKSGDTISVNVIRSGERGVLYAKPAPTVVEFTQWDAIRSISHPSIGSIFDSKRK